jgi:hypothetical protein
MRRRQFIGLIGGAAASPLAARGQQKARYPTIALIGLASTSDEERENIGAFDASARDGHRLPADFRSGADDPRCSGLPTRRDLTRGPISSPAPYPDAYGNMSAMGPEADDAGWWVAAYQPIRLHLLKYCGAWIAPSDSICGSSFASGPCTLTVKHQGQNTHNYVDRHIWGGRTFVRVETESNDGILAFGRLYRPEVKARGQIRVNAAAHYSSSRQGRSRRLQFGFLGFYVPDLFDGYHPAVRNEHNDDRNLEECCKSLGSD